MISVPEIEDLCNGSTPDSDSVCGGSNPSSSANKKRHPNGWRFLLAENKDVGYEPISIQLPGAHLFAAGWTAATPYNLPPANWQSNPSSFVEKDSRIRIDFFQHIISNLVSIFHCYSRYKQKNVRLENNGTV